MLPWHKLSNKKNLDRIVHEILELGPLDRLPSSVDLSPRGLSQTIPLDGRDPTMLELHVKASDHDRFAVWSRLRASR